MFQPLNLSQFRQFHTEFKKLSRLKSKTKMAKSIDLKK